MYGPKYPEMFALEASLSSLNKSSVSNLYPAQLEGAKKVCFLFSQIPAILTHEKCMHHGVIKHINLNFAIIIFMLARKKKYYFEGL